jgi:hypothetical protein
VRQRARVPVAVQRKYCYIFPREGPQMRPNLPAEPLSDIIVKKRYYCLKEVISRFSSAAHIGPYQAG